MNVMIFYCNSIFFYSNSGISSDVASVIVGIVLLVSCFAAIYCITRLGRRVILITSMAGMSICYFILGGCFFVIERSGESGEAVEAAAQNISSSNISAAAAGGNMTDQLKE